MPAPPPASDGVSAARIEEAIVAGSGRAEILTKFPADELFITNHC